MVKKKVQLKDVLYKGYRLVRVDADSQNVKVYSPIEERFLCIKPSEEVAKDVIDRVIEKYRKYRVSEDLPMTESSASSTPAKRFSLNTPSTKVKRFSL